MKYIISILTLVLSLNAMAICSLKPEPNVQGCKINGFIASDPSRPDHEKVWICINYRQVEDETNLTKFNISGRVKAPRSISSPMSEINECDLMRRSISASANGSIYDTCGSYRIYTSIQTQAEKNPREGYRVNLVVETMELSGGPNKFAGEGKSVCEIGFIDAQIVENSESKHTGFDCR